MAVSEIQFCGLGLLNHVGVTTPTTSQSWQGPGLGCEGFQL